MGLTISWVGIQISCSDWLCWSAVQHLLQLRQRLDIMAVAMVDMDMVAIVAMEDMDMGLGILVKDQLMQSLKLRLMLATCMVDMAVASMVVDTMEREMLTLNLRLMLDIMEELATVDMVDMDMAVVSMVLDTMEREMLMLNLRLMLDIMEDMATVDMVDMDMAVVSMVVDTMEREMLTLNLRLMLDIMEDMATMDMVDMVDMAMVVVTTLVRLL